jgi:hypothetical protein
VGKWGVFTLWLFFACPAGATAQPLAASPPYGWDVSLAGKITFLPARLGPKPLFLFREKKTAVLDSEKEKGDQWR